MRISSSRVRRVWWRDARVSLRRRGLRHGLRLRGLAPTVLVALVVALLIMVHTRSEKGETLSAGTGTSASLRAAATYGLLFRGGAELFAAHGQGSRPGPGGSCGSRRGDDGSA